MALLKNNSMMVLCLAALVLLSATSVYCHAPPARNSDGHICIKYYPACTTEGCVKMCGDVVGANTGHCDNYGFCCCPN
uniref:Knottin scorpion toxin-like domain-containing protein n=1 Tax=Oryza punctata TaxID=4537 RepID=A0A0E0LF97_ORYPU